MNVNEPATPPADPAPEPDVQVTVHTPEPEPEPEPAPEPVTVTTTVINAPAPEPALESMYDERFNAIDDQLATIVGLLANIEQRLSESENPPTPPTPPEPEPEPVPDRKPDETHFWFRPVNGR